MAGYLPDSDSAKMQWLNNFSAKLSTYQTTLGLTAATITAVKNDAANFAYIVGLLATFRDYSQQVTAYKDQLRRRLTNSPVLGAIPAPPATPVFPSPVVDDIFGRTQKLVQLIKNNAAYTVAMGKDLGIVPIVVAGRETVLKPIIALTLNGNQPVISIRKQKAQSINLYVDRGDDKGFVFLATSTTAKYVDVSPLPLPRQSAIWTYEAIYCQNNKEIGQRSDPAKITVAGV